MQLVQASVVKSKMIDLQSKKMKFRQEDELGDLFQRHLDWVQITINHHRPFQM